MPALNAPDIDLSAPDTPLTHVPAGRKDVKAWGAERLTTCGAARTTASVAGAQVTATHHLSWTDDCHGGWNAMRFDRITTDPDQMGGLPYIRGLRIPVAAVIDMVADGMTPADIIDAFPDLQPQDIEQALHYAAESVREREIPIRAAS
jgi:uncharacterized protein (DUF433 family)